MDQSKYVSKLTGHALVLGGSGGIGYEIVLALVANGARSISFTYASNKKKADELSAELNAQGVKSHAGQLDQADEASVARVLDAAAAEVGEEISTAVNTIGISPNVPLEEQALEGALGWRNVFEVNVFGCFISTRAIAERMKKAGVSGSIVLITSTNGINSQSSISTHYDASKAAQGMMMRILAEHYAPHVRINGVAPGWIATKMNDTLPQDEREKETAKIWAGRFADPSEVARFVAYLCGSGGSYAYGQNYMIDGGYR